MSRKEYIDSCIIMYECSLTKPATLAASLAWGLLRLAQHFKKVRIKLNHVHEVPR